MTAYPVTLTHPDSEATYVASTRLEMLDALRNGWLLSQEERKAMVAKTSGKRKATPQQAPADNP